METLADITDIMVILRLWEDEHQGMNYDPVPALTRYLSEHCIDVNIYLY